MLSPRAAKVIAAYKAAYPDPVPPGPGTFAGYDSAMIVIDAIGRAIDANHGSIPTREQVRQQIARTKNFRGVTGTFTFDAAGDATQPTFQLLRITGGTWTPALNLVATAQ